MKGNEARVVFFLHPVKESKEGEVSETKEKIGLPGFRSIFLTIGAIIALGVLAYVLYVYAYKQDENLNKQIHIVKSLSHISGSMDANIPITEATATNPTDDASTLSAVDITPIPGF